MSVTSSPSETEALQDYADTVAAAVGGAAEIAFETIKVRVAPGQWTSAHETARDDLGLVFFSWLSAVDWSNEVDVGDPPAEEVEERYEVLTTVADMSEGKRVIFSTDLAKDSALIDSLVSVYAGANWHEREAAEMFGIEFAGHPDPGPLYLPESFIGNPLLKSYPLLSREVKPWPGSVDVEPMPESTEPSTENPEA
jgi:NADH:ubiquinone oxidoreductase subunit C